MNPKQKHAAKMLLQKIRREDPQFYNVLRSRGITQLGSHLAAVEAEVEQASWFDKITQAAQSFYQLKQQKDIMDMQVERAAQGLPPLNVSNLALPPVRVEVTAPEFAPTFMDAKKLLLPVAGAAIAFLLFRKKR